jgi:predicted transcriptional regulator
MKQILIELDAETAARLERVAPGSARRRSEFVRAAIREALWRREEQETAEAYARRPDSAADAYLDPALWDRRASRRKRNR